MLPTPSLHQALLLVVVLHRRCLPSTRRAASTSASPRPWTWCTPAAAAARCCRWPPAALWGRGWGSRTSTVEGQSLGGLCQVSLDGAGASAWVSHAFKACSNFTGCCQPCSGRPLWAFLLHDWCEQLPSHSQTGHAYCSQIANNMTFVRAGQPPNQIRWHPSRSTDGCAKGVSRAPQFAGMREPTPTLPVGVATSHTSLIFAFSCHISLVAHLHRLQGWLAGACLLCRNGHRWLCW